MVRLMYLTNLQEGAERTRQNEWARIDDCPQQNFWQIALQKLYFSLNYEERFALLTKLNEVYKKTKNIEEVGLLRGVVGLDIESNRDIYYFDKECVYLIEPARNQQIASHALHRILRNSPERFQNRYPNMSFEIDHQTSILKISLPLLTICNQRGNKRTLNLEGTIEGNLVPNDFKFQIVKEGNSYLELPEFLTMNTTNSIEFINALKLDLESHYDTRTVSELAGSDTEIKMLIPIPHDKENNVPMEMASTRICDISLSINNLEKTLTSLIHRKEFV